jgi:hypothetical protein
MRGADVPLDPVSIRAGRRILLIVHNADATQLHEFMIGREPAPGGFAIPFFSGVAATYTGTVMTGERHVPIAENGTMSARSDSTHLQLTAQVRPGAHATVLFTAPTSARGDWLMGCVMLDHFSRGERGIFHVE